MEPVRAQAVPAGLIENKYSPVIGFKQFTEGESQLEKEPSLVGGRRRDG